MLATQCEPVITWNISNQTGETIDVDWLVGSSFLANDPNYYAELSVGDRTYLGCNPCELPAGEAWQDFASPTENRDVVVTARSSFTLQMLYRQRFSYKELKSMNWTIEITDMREPGSRLTDEPFPIRDSTLTCDDCQLINPAHDRDERIYNHFTNRVRSYGSIIPEEDEQCRRAGLFLNRKLQGEEIIFGGFGSLDGSMRGKPVPGILDDSGLEVIYVFTIEGESVDELLIRNGVALASGPDGQHWDHLKRIENQERAEATGCLWQN